MSVSRTLGILALASLTLAPASGLAQMDDGANAGGQAGRGFGGHHGSRNRQLDAAPSSAPLISLPKLVPDPRQRLDAGAVLCGTEAELRQHQAAITARAAGRDEGEPAGCVAVREMTAVSVVNRDGLARTQVRTRDHGDKLGWTDAVIPDAQTSAR